MAFYITRNTVCFLFVLLTGRMLSLEFSTTSRPKVILELVTGYVENTIQCDKYSCSNGCDVDININKKDCSCTEKCLIWKNCCFDYLSECKNISKPRLHDYFSPETLDETTKLVMSYGQCIFYFGVGDMSVVSICPQGASDIDRKICHEMPERLIPLRHKTDPRLNFANIHCALCHGYDKPDLEIWQFEYRCSKSKTLNVTSIVESCGKLYSVYERTDELVCFPTRQEPPGIVDLNLQAKCEHYIRPVELNDTIYKNIDCAKLENADISEYSKEECYDKDRNNFIFFNTIRVMFDFKTNTLEVDSVSNLDLCNATQIFDPYYMMCRDLICPIHQHPMFGECYKNETIFMDARNQPFPLMNETIYIFFTYYFDAMPRIERFLQQDVISVQNVSKIIRDKNPPLVCTYILPRSATKIMALEVQAVMKKIPSNEDPLQIVSDFLTKERCLSHVTLMNFDPQEVSIQCSDVSGSLVSYKNVKLEIRSNRKFAVLEKQNQKVFYPFYSVGYKVSVSELLLNGQIDEIYVCEKVLKHYNMNCPMIVLKSNEFREINDAIRVVKSKQIIEKGKFRIIDGEAHVCVHYLLPSRRYGDRAQVITSMIVNGLSMVCLVLALIIYIRFKKLRNLGGKLNAVLCFWLVLGQGLLLVNLPDRKTCQIFAVVCHFVWLSAFGMMSAISVNMALTFHKTKLSDSREDGTRLTRLVFASLLIPSVVVIICCVLDFGIDNQKWKIGYGLDVCTAIANKRAILFVFIIPVSLFLLVNVICFVVTLCGIERSIRLSAIALKEEQREERSRILIYIKVSLIMGFAWIMGIIAALVDEPILWYVHIISNGLQGFFIFLSFICNQSTFDIMGCKFMSGRSLVYSSRSNKHLNRDDVKGVR